MTHQETLVIKRGFTLIETLIYVALFGLLFSGMLASVWPFLRGTQNVTDKVVIENEAAFVIRRINTAFASSTASITDPTAGNTSNTLAIRTYDGVDYSFVIAGNAMTVQKNTGAIIPLTASRVTIQNFSARHIAPAAGLPRFIEYSFDITGATTTHYGPIRKYFSF